MFYQIVFDQNVREWLCDMGGEDAVVFDNPEFDPAIVGISEDGRAVYDYNKMVAHLMETDGMSELEAADFIDYNTLRAIPYAGEHAPIVMYPREETE